MCSLKNSFLQKMQGGFEFESNENSNKVFFLDFSGRVFLVLARRGMKRGGKS